MPQTLPYRCPRPCPISTPAPAFPSCALPAPALPAAPCSPRVGCMSPGSPPSPWGAGFGVTHWCRDMTVFSGCCPGSGSGCRQDGAGPRRGALGPGSPPCPGRYPPAAGWGGVQAEPPPPPGTHPPHPLSSPTWGQQCGRPHRRGARPGCRQELPAGRGRQGGTVPGMVLVTHRAAAWHRLGLGRSHRSNPGASSIILTSVFPPIPNAPPAPGIQQGTPYPPVPGVVQLRVPIPGHLGELEGPVREG